MITKLTFTAGYPLKIPAFAKPLEFKPGLNVLFGPNGCGKSTAIRLAGVMCGCRSHGGWTTFVEPGDRYRGWSDGKKHRINEYAPYPDCFTGNERSNARAVVEWDGTPAFMSMANSSDAPVSYFGEPRDGLTSSKYNDQVMQMFADKRASIGERRLMRLSKLVSMKDVPDVTTLTIDANCTWTKAVKDFTDYMKSLPRTGPATFLLDEPDRSLSLPMQERLWEVLVKIAEHRQIIVATHSICALRGSAVNMIEMENGYVNKCRAVIERMALA